MGKEMNEEFGHVEDKQSSWVPVTPAKLFEARPQPDNLHSQIDDSLLRLNAQTSLPRNRDAAAINSVLFSDRNTIQIQISQDLYQEEENKQDMGICTSNTFQGEPAKDILGSDSPVISTPSKKRNAKKRDNSNIDLDGRSLKLPKKKKHRPKVVVEGMSKRTPRPKTPKSVTPRRATSKRDASTTKRKYARKNKLSETDSVCKKPKKSCRRDLNFEIEKYSVAEIQNDIEVKTTSTLELKKVELMVEEIAGGVCDVANLENQIRNDHSFSFGLEALKRSQNSLQVYKRVFKCLISSRKHGPNFPHTCKKRRFNRRQKETTYSHWWSVAIEEHDQHGYKLRSRNNSAKISSPIKHEVRDSFMCMVRLCNSTVKIKKKMRSNKSVRRQNLASLIAIPKCNQLPPTLFKPAAIVSSESLPTPHKPAPIGSTKRLPPLVKPAPIVNKKSQPPPNNEILTGDGQGFHAPETCFDVIHPGQFEKRVEKKQTDIGLSLVNVDSCYNEVSSLSLVNQTIFSQRKGVEILQGLISHREAIVPTNHKKKVSKKQNKMRPSEGCSPPEVEDIFLTANLRDPLELLKVIDSILPKLEGLHIEDSGNGTIVPFEGPFDPIKKRKLSVKVNLDAETVRVWNLLMVKDGIEDVDNIADEDKKKWWEDEREVFCGRVDSFIARMHLIQGDRRFSAWKGSVVDSVVGVFLTQNVSDHLSSSAFMSLAAKFPVQSTSRPEACYEDTKLPDNRELIEINMVVGEQRAGSKTEECMTNESEAETLNKASRTVACDEDSNTDKSDLTEKEKDLHEQPCCSGMDVKGETPSSATKKKGATVEKKEAVDWDNLRKLHSAGHRQRCNDTMDSVDWEAVKCAQLNEVANTIRQRGQHFIIAGRIKDFLDRVVAHHESIDLEWLRDVPPDDVKEFLLSVCGLGLKSVECVRLLALQHNAFPVDTNVGRIAVRLGWVPLQPLPEELQIHLLKEYPVMDSIQKYLWPRLCKLDQRTLYELHYQLITFGKVFCTKRRPNCNPCPMRGECRHFASAFASAKLALPGPREKSVVTSIVSVAAVGNSNVNAMSFTLPLLEAKPYSESGYQTSHCKPIIEEPASPEPEYAALPEKDIEDFYNDDSDEIPTIKLNFESFAANLLGYMDKYDMSPQEGDFTKALVALNYEAASIPRPKLKSISRLRTQHQVYELPDSHPLLIGLEKREPDDQCPYLLSIWTPGETSNSLEPPKKRCTSQESEDLCNEDTCFSCNSIRQQNSQTIRGTILIPCRTAMRGRFPLNGTYFQVNEVFSDHESSLHPISVPTAWIWNLPQRTVYCGTSATSIFRDLSTEEIQHCFWRGYICVRGFDRKTRAPRPLGKRLHASGVWKAKTEKDEG